jgi:hemoglobin/transferrin/lactoferrin receptor protein
MNVRTSIPVLLLATMSSVAFTEDIARLPEIIVTPMRYEIDPAQAPYVTHTISQSTLSENLPRTTPDVFKGVPSVMVQKTGYGQGSPFMRGFTGFRTLMMVDGIRLNNSVFRDGPNQYWNTVDPFSIKQYEVVMGPASVLYGSDAIGGTVNALTHTPPEWAGQPMWEKSLTLRGATADESIQARGQVGGRASEHLGIHLGYSYKDFGDLRGGSDVGNQPETGYSENAVDGRMDYTFDSGANLTLAHQRVNQDDAWRTHRTIYGIDWEGLKRGDDKVHTYDQQRTLTYLRLADREHAGSFIDGYQLTLSRHAQDEDLYRVRTDDRRDEQGFDVTTWGAAAELESLTTAGRLVYGMDYYYDDVESYSRRYAADGRLTSVGVQGPVADDASYGLLGMFAQNTVVAGDHGLEITPGVRYTRAELDAHQIADPVSGDAVSRSDEWDQFSGSLRALQPFGNNNQYAVFSGLSQGFRAPNLSDLTRLDSARSNELETPVDTLDPEEFLSFETGTRAAGERYAAEVVWYYTWIDDLIVRTPTGQEIDGLTEVTKRNSGEGHVQGAEMTFQMDVVTDWQLRLAGSWMEGEADTYPTSSPEKVRDNLSRVMPLTGQAAVRWTPTSRVWLEAVVDAADKADKLSAEDKRDTQRIPPGGTPGYVIFTLRSGITMTPNASLTLALENIADEDYRIHGSGVNEPGRQLVANFSCTF